MYCRNCGHGLKPEQRYCPACGAARPDAPAAQQDAVGPGVVSRPEGAPTPVAGRKPSRRIAAVALAATALVAIAFAIVWVAGGGLRTASPPEVLAAVFGADEPIHVARTARIVPQDASGTPMIHYTVRLVRAVDAVGDSVDVGGGPTLTVNTGDGFTVDDWLDDMPDGTYYANIEDEDGGLMPMPPIQVDEEGERGDVVILPDEDDPAPAPQTAGARWRFAEKLAELGETWGEPAVAYQHKDNVAARATGLSFARLVDFGDGAERLVVAYCTRADEPASTVESIEAYRIEVWGYDASADEEVLQAEGLAPVLGGGVSYVDLYGSDDGRVVLRLRAAADAAAGDRYVGIMSGGRMGSISTDEVLATAWTSETMALLHGFGMSEQEASSWTAEELLTVPADLDFELLTVAESIKTVGEVAEQLEEVD